MPYKGDCWAAAQKLPGAPFLIAPKEGDLRSCATTNAICPVLVVRIPAEALRRAALRIDEEFRSIESPPFSRVFLEFLLKFHRRRAELELHDTANLPAEFPAHLRDGPPDLTLASPLLHESLFRTIEGLKCPIEPTYQFPFLHARILPRVPDARQPLLAALFPVRRWPMRPSFDGRRCSFLCLVIPAGILFPSESLFLSPSEVVR